MMNKRVEKGLSTRQRIVDAATRKFREVGYEATSIEDLLGDLQISRGALYHHFKSKEALLEAGIDRQLDRRRAMHDIRTLFAGLGDLRIELTMLGRYVLTVLDEETQLLQIAARTPPGQSPRLNNAYAALVDGLSAEVADWIKGWAPEISKHDATAVAAVGVDALLGRRATQAVFRAPAMDMQDEDFIAAWTAMLAGRVEALR